MCLVECWNTLGIEWKPCWRIVPSRFPLIELFDQVADPGDLLAGLAVASPLNIDALCGGTAADTGLVLPASFVTGFLDRDDPAVRGAASDLAPAANVPAFRLRDSLSDGVASIRRAAVVALAHRGHRDKLIIALANAPSAAVAEALGAIGDDEAIVALGHFAIRHSAAAPSVITVLRYMVPPRADRLAARLEAECARPITGNASRRRPGSDGGEPARIRARLAGLAEERRRWRPGLQLWRESARPRRARGLLKYC